MIIRSLSVVEDPQRTSDPCNIDVGPGLATWSFGKLMSDMAGDSDPSTFVEEWLATFKVQQNINGDATAPRPNIDSRILNTWPRLPDGRLDLRQSPFRLLAIVYRPDLTEGRFVFGALSSECVPMNFTVILEYSLPSDPGCIWAQRFHSLAPLYGAPTFNEQLQSITDRFAGKDRSLGRANGSAINQVRTGESDLGDDGIWEIREFRLQKGSISPRSAKLVPSEVAGTPREDLNGSSLLADIMNGKSTLGAPESLLSLRGAKARLNLVWQSPGVDSAKRHEFALKTCNGCHSAETATGAVHIAPRKVGAISDLSSFLTGVKGVEDPVDPTIKRDFGDLDARAQRMLQLLAANCQ